MRDVVALMLEWGPFPLAAAYVILCALLAGEGGAGQAAPHEHVGPS